MDLARPSVIGSTTPGNSTVLRTGTIMSASGGNAGPEAPPVDALSFALTCCSATIYSRLLQGDDEATGRGRAAYAGIAAGRQPQPPVKASLRQFEPVDRRSP